MQRFQQTVRYRRAAAHRKRSREYIIAAFRENKGHVESLQVDFVDLGEIVEGIESEQHQKPFGGIEFGHQLRA